MYLSAIKTLLIGERLISPDRELVFVPSGGAKGVSAVVPVIAAKEDELPIVLFDSDGPGNTNASSLKKGTYQGQQQRVLQTGEFVPIPDSEVEDLLPEEIMCWAVDKRFRMDDEFADSHLPGVAIVGQVESYADSHGIALKLGWKVELASRQRSASKAGARQSR